MPRRDAKEIRDMKVHQLTRRGARVNFLTRSHQRMVAANRVNLLTRSRQEIVATHGVGRNAKRATREGSPVGKMVEEAGELRLG
jgi:hypothetical protein